MAHEGAPRSLAGAGALVLLASALLATDGQRDDDGSDSGRSSAGLPTVELAGIRADSRIRIGLATDVEAFTVECCPDGATILLGRDRHALDRDLEVLPGAAGEMWFRVQAAALEDEQQAERLAARLAGLTGLEAHSTFDAGIGLYRVRVGRFESHEAAENLRTRYADRGLRGAWIAREGGLEGAGSLRVRFGDERYVLPGRWLGVRSMVGGVLHWNGSTYRGSLLVFLNDRGRLNIVNELPVEDYLRGVVPLEMGPELYDRLESLKAQTIAARTFAVRNLGQFETEGYDLCTTVRCQVYGGAAVEHALSDRAISETASQVLVWQDDLVEALYSSSCGGSTEDVGVVFPAIRAEYLRAVPCIEADPSRLASSMAPGTELAHGVTGAFLPSRADLGPVADLERRLVELASIASLPVPADDRLASVERSEVARFVSSVFDTSLDQDLLRRILAPKAGETDSLEPSGSERLLLELGLSVGAMDSRRVYFVRRDPPDALIVRVGASWQRLELPESLGLFRRQGGSLRSSTLELRSGDRLLTYWSQGRLLGIVQEHAEAELRVDVENPGWQRQRSMAQLRGLVGQRYPGFVLRDLEIVDRGSSGRVARLRLQGMDGEAIELEGLAVRWALDVPDTWFSMERRAADAGGGWIFRGRGRGHGVGLCQKGAFSMARRGLSYGEILSHYYSGVVLARIAG